MGAHTSFGARDRWRLRQNRWWILAAALGVLTVQGFASVIHDNFRRHVAATLVRRAAAERIATYASARVTILALETFAPAADAGAGGRDVVARLVRHQAAAVRCEPTTSTTRCRDVLPARSFFRFDLATKSIDAAPVSSGAALPESALLAGVARAAASHLSTRPDVRVTASRTLGDMAAVTLVQFDSASAPKAVVGLIAPARELGTVLFGAAAESTVVEENGARLLELDSASILVTAADSTPLFGNADTARFNSALRPAGPLEGLTIGLALTGAHFHPSVLNVVPQRLLWHNGFLLLATVLVIIFAVGSTQREVLLARTRSDFVAGVSHDLRMPLAQILLASETLVKHRSAGETERHALASAILRESRRLITLVENLLLVSRSGAVELRPRLEPARVDDLFAGVVEAVELAVEDAHQSIDARPSPSIAVLGDHQLVRQALVNLVDNALKYGKPGQRIELVAEQVSATFVRLYVDDQGLGIPRAERERVFAPYARLGRDQVSERTGTGLGLFVVRQIVEACGGRVWLDDRPGGAGTRAVIELKVADVSAPVAPAAEPVA